MSLSPKILVLHYEDVFESVSVDSEENIAGWNGPEDPQNPFNWNVAKKWRVTLLACFMTFVVQTSGTAMTSVASQINASFNLSDEHFPNSYWPILAWNLGGAAAPMLALPLMEHFGVRWSYLSIYVLMIIFTLPQALAQSFMTLVITRIITGGCSGVLSNITSGIISDIWRDGRSKSFAISVYIWCLLAGLSFGPVIGSVVGKYASWRWIFFSQTILYAILAPVLLLRLPEVRPDVILAKCARSIRATTGKPVCLVPGKEPISLHDVLKETIMRPSRMLCTEGVVLSFGLWSAFCVGTAFMFTQSITQVYSELYRWSFFGTGIVQSAVVVGELFGLLASVYQDRHYFNSAAHNKETPGLPIPEARLTLSIPGSLVGLTAGMFGFAWTSYPTIHWMIPTVALAFIGFGMFTVVSAVSGYIMDAYSKYAASAIAGVAFLENILAAFLPLATQPMYTNLGFQWSSSVLGFIALALSSIPLVLQYYGPLIRKRSPFISQAAHDGV